MVFGKFARQILVVLSAAGVSALGGCMTTTSTTTTPVTSHSRTTTTQKSTPAPAPAPLSAQSTDALITTATRQVVAAEQGFSKTMADRNFKAFVTFLSPNAVFFSGSEIARGPDAVAEKWAPYFTARRAPFSWAPDHVEVSASCDLALSTGPVFQDGKIVGRFSSVWRLEAPNTWRIVFDKGEAVAGIKP